MPNEQTSSRVSKIAGELLGETPITDDVCRQIIDGIAAANNAAAAYAAIRHALAPHLADVRTVAASALSQDETKGQ